MTDARRNQLVSAAFGVGVAAVSAAATSWAGARLLKGRPVLGAVVVAVGLSVATTVLFLATSPADPTVTP